MHRFDSDIALKIHIGRQLLLGDFFIAENVTHRFPGRRKVVARRENSDARIHSPLSTSATLRLTSFPCHRTPAARDRPASSRFAPPAPGSSPPGLFPEGDRDRATCRRTPVRHEDQAFLPNG